MSTAKLLVATSLLLILVGCATTPEQEAANRSAEANKIQRKYATYTTPQLQLKRQEIAATIPDWYWGTGIAGAIQAGQIEGKKKQVAEIDRELLRRAESGDTAGQQMSHFLAVSTPPGARIEAGGKFLGITPIMVSFTGHPGAQHNLQATPATLDIPVLGYAYGFKETDGNLVPDDASASTIGFVTPNTPAAQMGLVKGDKILAMNGIVLPETTGSKESAQAYKSATREQLTKTGFAAPITLKVLRDGKEIEVKGTTAD
ncbi:MAG TPA: hypothetical protein VJA21_16490, partial [Verrucomicrobiae bacterium]